MSTEMQAGWLFRINAVINWILSVPAIVAPAATAAGYGGPQPNYPSIVRLWASLVFMFGCMFFETSRDIVGKRYLMKYNWIEKTITATALTMGYFAGDVPPRLMLLIVFTNWIWIPFVLFYDLAIRRQVQRAQTVTSGT